MDDHSDTSSVLPQDPPRSSLSYEDEENDIENRSNQSYKAFDTGIFPGSQPLTPEVFDRFKNVVFSARPNIAYLYQQHGQNSLYNHSKSHIREHRNKIIKKRRPEFNEVLWKHVQRVLGSAIADSLVKQLKTNDSISTVQHFSPLSHPDTFNAVLQNALPYFDAHQPGLQNVVVLACAGVSFNNTKFPRGHLFHSFQNKVISTNQISFFGHSADARPVIHHAPFGSTAPTEILHSIVQLERENKITKEMKTRICTLITDIYAQPHPLTCNDYVDQLTITNYWLFKNLFTHYSKPVPSLLFLAQEKVVLDLLLANHLYKETVINKLLFDENVSSLIDKYFDGVTGAFSKEKQLGTYLFWGLPDRGRCRVQLWREENMLKSKDGCFSVELTPAAIEEAIRTKKLIPSVLLTFCVLAFYYGFFLGGGYEQTYYLSQAKKNYLKILEALKDSESIEACAQLITTNLVIPRPLLTYLEGPNDVRLPATALDMLLYGDQGSSWGKILAATKQVTLGTFIERTLPSIYREYVKEDPEKATNSQIVERDIEKLNGLDHKIPIIGKIY